MSENQKPRQLVVCCDGTWNIPENESPTHVGRIAKLAALSEGPDGEERVVFYMRGVGGRYAMDRLLGGAIGQGLHANIKDAYLFLVTNYRPRDSIFIFGFSRGAFTARALAGMIDSVGLLTPDHANRLGRAYRQYRRLLREDEPEVNRSMRRLVEIQFLGVFDTVGAMGIPILGLEETLKFRTNILPENVRYARHALALHERRMNFTPTVWQLQDDAPHDPAKEHLAVDPDGVNRQRLRQMWFAGVHSDIGGGYPRPRPQSMSASGLFSLEWMLDEASGAGLTFDPQRRQEIVNDLIGKSPTGSQPTASTTAVNEYEIHNSFSLFYLATNIRRAFVNAVLRGDYKTRRRVVESGAACQEIHPSVWEAYFTAKHPNSGDEMRPPGISDLRFLVRHRTAPLPKPYRKARVERIKDLRQIEQSARSAASEQSGGGLMTALMNPVDAPEHGKSSGRQAIAILALLAVLVVLWQLLTRELAPSLTIPNDALDEIALAVAAVIVVGGVAFAAYSAIVRTRL